MKSKLLLIGSICSLLGCQQTQPVADPSAAQQQSAHSAYIDLRDGKFDAFMQHLEPELQTHFQSNEKLMRKFSKAIPEGEYKSHTLMTKQVDEAGKQYKVSYEYAYPKNLVQYDVSFDQAGGSTKIRNLNIQVFGE